MADFRVFTNCVHLRNPYAVEVDRSTPPPRRGSVCGFSPASRRRLRRLLATVRWPLLPPAHFVTLTFHDVPADWLGRFRALLEWLRRRDAWYIWRLELQKRGAPHFHLIVWCSRLNIEELESHWHSVANPSSEAHRRYGTHVREVESYRAACVYLSKYLAKVDAPGALAGTPLDGRRVWGASRDLPVAALHEWRLSARGFWLLRRAARRLLRARRRSRSFGPHWGARAIWLHVDQATAAQLFRLVEDELRPLVRFVGDEALQVARNMAANPPPTPPLIFPPRAPQAALPLSFPHGDPG